MGSGLAISQPPKAPAGRGIGDKGNLRTACRRFTGQRYRLAVDRSDRREGFQVDTRVGPGGVVGEGQRAAIDRGDRGARWNPFAFDRLAFEEGLGAGDQFF